MGINLFLRPNLLFVIIEVHSHLSFHPSLVMENLVNIFRRSNFFSLLVLLLLTILQYLIIICQNRYLFSSACYFLTKLYLRVIIRTFQDPWVFLLVSICLPILFLSMDTVYDLSVKHIAYFRALLSQNRIAILEFENSVFTNYYKINSRVETKNFYCINMVV